MSLEARVVGWVVLTAKCTQPGMAVPRKANIGRLDLENPGLKFGLWSEREWPARGEWSARAGDGSTEGTVILTSWLGCYHIDILVQRSNRE